MKKRLLATLLALVMVLSLLPTAALASSTDLGADPAPQSESNQVAYAVEGGKIYFDPTTGAIVGCDASVTSADIPNSIEGVAVTSIGASAFRSCKKLINVTIPEGVTSIEYSAFYYCEGLTHVTIPSSVTRIGFNAFYNCSSLTNVTIPEGVTSIRDHTFYECRSLTSVTIPESVKSIEEDAFMRCESLTSITIPNNVTSIGTYAFGYCSGLTSITIPESVTSIGNMPFIGCTGLTSAGPIGGDYSYQFGWTKEIPNQAFSYCASLTSVTFPEGITSIGDYAFQNCSSLTSVTIPLSVASIGSLAFKNCSSLTAINVAEGNQSYCSEDGVLFTNDKTELIRCPEGKTGAYSVPVGVTRIGLWAFQDCTKLTTVTMPDGITWICTSAFENCNRLTSVTIPYSVTRIGDNAFQNCKNLTSVTIPERVTDIGTSAFKYCNSLTNVTLPGSVINIGICAFESCASLASVTILEGVTHIEMEMFDSCKSLTNVTIPVSVTKISAGAFSDCNKLTDVYYSGSEEQWGQISIVAYNDPLTSATIHYNSTGPDEPIDSNQITFRFDADTVAVGDELAIGANIPNSSGLQDIDIVWSSSNEEIAVVMPGVFSEALGYAGATVRGISAGTADITVTLADGRTGSTKIRVVNGANMMPEEFNADVYRADLLTNRLDMPYSKNLNDLLYGRTPSRIITEELRSDWTLLTAGNAWRAMENTFDVIDKPSNLYKISFEEKDFYTAILLDILKANTSSSQSDYLDTFIKEAKSWMKQATKIVKLQFDIDELDSGLTEEDKRAIADAYMEYFQKELKFDTWDTNHSFLGYMDTVFKYSSKIMDAVDDLESFADQIVSAFALVAMSESSKNVVRELYKNCPDNLQLQLALLDIIDYMDATEMELLMKLVSGGLTIAGVRMASMLVDEFYDALILSLVPEVKILIAFYNVGKWYFDELAGVSKIAEECNKILMTTEFETLMVSTVQGLAGQFNRDRDITNAATFLKAVDIYFALLDKSSDQAVSFVDALDSGKLQKLKNFFSGDQSKESLKETIKNIKTSYSICQDSLWNGWILSLLSDFPDSGLYEQFSDRLIDEVAKYSTIRKKIDVHCPVNVMIYDSNDNLVAYVQDGSVHCDENVDLTLVVHGDEKTILIYDGTDYRMECVGTDVGAMDVLVTEYDSSEEIRNVYFYDLPLENGIIYKSDIDDKTLGSATYEIKEVGGNTFEANLDTYNPPENQYTLTVVSGVAVINGEERFSIELYEGQEINIRAYTPEECKFTGWISNVSEATFSDAMNEVTTMLMPASDVVISATVAEMGFSVIFDANGGNCDTVVLATNLSGKLDKLPIPNYDGHTFLGWFSEIDSGSKITIEKVFSSNTTVYAHWTPVVYTVTFIGGPDATGTAPTQADTAEGGTFTLPENTFEREGYTFAGWNDGTKTYQPGEVYTMPSADVTFTAQWTENTPPAPTTYTVTFTGGLDTTGTPPTQADTAEGDTFTLPENTFEREGYTFAGWNDGENTYQPGDTYTMPGKDVIFTAQWTENIPPTPPEVSDKYIVSYDANGGTGTMADTLVGPSDTYTFPACGFTAPVGKEFRVWQVGNAEYKPNDVYTFTADTTVIAIWQAIHTVTFTGGPGATGTAPTQAATAEGGTFSLPKNTFKRTGYTFVGWNDGTKTYQPGEVYTMPDVDVTFTAQWKKNAETTDPGPINPNPQPNPKPDPKPTPQPETPWVNPFSDVSEDEWYFDAVKFVCENGLMNGTSTTTFEPATTTTRGMVVTILHRMEGTPAAGTSSFADVEADQWYTDGVAWAAENGVVSGYGDGNFGPDDTITREQMVAILYRYAKLKDYDVTFSNSLASFADVDSISDYAVDAMRWAIDNGLIVGKGDGILDPGGSAIRAEVAAIFMRFCKIIANR